VTTKIENPYSATEHRTGADDALDATWATEVNQVEAQEIQKRNGAPAGTYVTDPESYAPILTTGKRDEKNKAGDVIGPREMATVIVRGTAKIKGTEVTQVLRFDLSPDSRHKKIYEGDQWTGEYDLAKDDLASRLWANAVNAYKEYTGVASFTRVDVLDYLKTTPVALQTMQGNRGDLVVLKLTNRGRKARA
jgi:hypothetical protein